MVHIFRRVALAAICFCLVACSDPKEPTSGGGNIEFGSVEWDGVKRAEVFYEIFVRSFADSDGDGTGDLNGVTEKLDYLDELGVSGIWLMPINPSPSYHGYDVMDYTAVNPDYGTMEDFDNLLAEAHKRDIKVIIDFVMNHSSSRHPWFLSASESADSPYRDYYVFKDNGDYVANFDRSMPDLNYKTITQLESAPVWEEICSAAEFWLERGTDGFRLDAVLYLYDTQSAYDNAALLKKFHERMKLTNPDVYIVGEAWTNPATVALYYDGLRVLFDFDGWDKLRWALDNETGKWYPKDMLDNEMLFKPVREDYIRATKLSNHDEDRTASVLGGDENKAKMAAKILLTVSGEPYLYYGEEIGTEGLKSDGGDINVRRALDWNEIAAQEGDAASILNVYKQFSALRNANPIMALGEMTIPDDIELRSNAVMAFYREYEGTKYLVLHNLSSSQYMYTVKQAVARGVMEHGGASIVRENSTRYIATLPPYASVICELQE